MPWRRMLRAGELVCGGFGSEFLAPCCEYSCGLLRKIDKELKIEKYLPNRILYVDAPYFEAPSRVSPSPSAAQFSISNRPKGPSVKDVFVRLVRHPVKHLLHNWNWKSAVLSSLLRASLFFFTNISAGRPAAVAALKTELVFRVITSGFYGALTEAFREAEPPWAAAVAVAMLLPFANHSLELIVHWIRGTHNLFASILASVIFTAISTLFNFHLMRRGALIVGAGRSSLVSDLIRMPKLAVEFVVWLPRTLARIASRGEKPGSVRGDKRLPVTNG